MFSNQVVFVNLLGQRQEAYILDKQQLYLQVDTRSWSSGLYVAVLYQGRTAIKQQLLNISH